MLNFKEILSYTLVPLLPVMCLLLSAVQFSVWPYISLIVIAIICPVTDYLLGRGATPSKVNHTAKMLPYLLFLAHLVLLPVGVWALTQDNSTFERIVLFLSLGLFFGTISMANGHELIHRRDRMSFNIGRIIFTSLLFGHHVSAHLLIHHRYAGTRKDPATARLGQSLYRFIVRAWLQSYRRGRRAENMRRYSAGRLNRIHPYTYYVGGAFFTLAVMFGLFGLSGMLIYIALSCFASSQLLLVDYVQHYGLVRHKTKSGKYEPMGLQHSWNAPFFFSSRMTLNAPNHSDHHTNPAKPYYELSSTQNVPMLPYPITVMATCALIPPLWFNLMDHRAADWR